MPFLDVDWSVAVVRLLNNRVRSDNRRVVLLSGLLKTGGLGAALWRYSGIHFVECRSLLMKAFIERRQEASGGFSVS